MGLIAGALNLADSDRSFVQTIGQGIVYDATMELLARYNEDIALQTSVFIAGVDDRFKLRYKMPGGGKLQKRGNQAPAGATKPDGGYDVAFPLEDFGTQLAIDDIALAYLTIDEWDRQVASVFIQDANTLRDEIFRPIFNNTAVVFPDKINGDLTVQPLANNDGVKYIPVLGQTVEAIHTHYVVAGYAATAISATNNPIAAIRDHLEEHFGAATGGANVVVFISQAQTALVELLPDFDAVPDNFVRVGVNTDIPERLPNVPGKILGRCDGAWIVEYRYIPNGYMLGTHLDAEAPMHMRVDPADTGLGQGLQMVAMDEQAPFVAWHWRHRYGIGTKNRLNGVVLQLKANGTYDVPAAYA